MRSVTFPLRILLVTALGALPPALRAQGAPASAPIANVRYELAFDKETAIARTLQVTTRFDVAGPGPVLLSLPDWTPGAYEISYFARWVEDFAPTDTAGRALMWDKLDFNTWRIEPSGAKSLMVRFTFVADTLDNAMAWSRPDFLLVNGTTVFLYPEGQPLAFASRVTVRTEEGWRVTTGLGPAPGGPAHTFAASNYHDLVDMPIFVGRFDLDSAQIAGTWVRYATYPEGSVSGAMRATAWDQLQRVIPPEVAVFGVVPWANYTVMQIADSTYQGASGLEHQSSHVDVVTPGAIGSEFQPSLYAHEIFHAWNVKRLRPAEMWPYVYDRPQPTPWLWVSEGITDYYADLAEVRGGVVDARGFYALTAAKIKEVGDTRPVALEDASLSTWIHPVDGTGYLYYPKGSLAGLMLDVMIRDGSDNRRSLDSVMRELYETVYRSGRGFTNADWWGAVSRAAGGKSFVDFEARYVNGREPFPWEALLPLAGLRITRPAEPRLGVYTVQDSSGILVTHVEEGGAAAAAGVREGDYLLAIGELSILDERFGEKFRAKFGTAVEGAPITVRVKRGAQTLNLAGKLHFAPGDPLVDADPKAGAKAQRIRNGILRGAVDR